MHEIISQANTLKCCFTEKAEVHSGLAQHEVERTEGGTNNVNNNLWRHRSGTFLRDKILLIETK